MDENDDDTTEEAAVMIPTDFIAETSLPTDMGAYRLRAYRVSTTNNNNNNNNNNENYGKEPCVIYYAEKPPGTLGSGSTSSSLTSPPMVEGVPVRIHDQCFTSEVFRSQR